MAGVLYLTSIVYITNLVGAGSGLGLVHQKPKASSQKTCWKVTSKNQCQEKGAPFIGLWAAETGPAPNPSCLKKRNRNSKIKKNNNENLQKQEEITKQVKPSNKKYFLKGIISKITGFRASHRSDSVSLFSGSLTTKKT